MENIVPEKELYGGRTLWKYALYCEHVVKWHVQSGKWAL